MPSFPAAPTVPRPPASRRGRGHPPAPAWRALRARAAEVLVAALAAGLTALVTTLATALGGAVARAVVRAAVRAAAELWARAAGG